MSSDKIGTAVSPYLVLYFVPWFSFTEPRGYHYIDEEEGRVDTETRCPNQDVRVRTVVAANLSVTELNITELKST